MKASELRIGNWILYADIWQQVFSIAETAINIAQNPLKMSFTGPILLTIKILLKCGIEDMSGDQMYAKLTLKIEDDGLLIFSWHIKKSIFEWVDFNGYAIDIKHLHQLQNFYFALTGQELTIKP